MSTKISSNLGSKDFWTNVRHWLRTLDDVVHGDPNDNLIRKLEQLESRLAQIEQTNLDASA